MARRELLQLAAKYDPLKSKIAGYYLSEKLDGTRCFWDGGLTRGMETQFIPWANTINPKNGHPKTKIKPYSTGLWSRYGNPIIAPDSFLDQLPPWPIDGELWAGRGNFQLARSICAGDTPDPRFGLIKYAVYGSPPIDAFIQEGQIKNTNFVANFEFETLSNFVFECACETEGFQSLDITATFEDELLTLNEQLLDEVVYLHPQKRLPEDEAAAKEMVEAELAKIVEKGGEGVIIRAPHSTWTPKRTKAVLKYKPFFDTEVMITGFTSGRKTDAGSKHLGRIGALITEYNGKRLEVAGLTDAERAFTSSVESKHAAANPGMDMPPHFQGEHFKVGQTITVKYRELTDDGLLKECRYWRKRDEE